MVGKTGCNLRRVKNVLLNGKCRRGEVFEEVDVVCECEEICSYVTWYSDCTYLTE